MELNSVEEACKAEGGEASGSKEPGEDVIQISERVKSKDALIYGVEDRPPWSTTVLMAFQHCSISISGCLTLPYILSGPLCFNREDLSRLIATNLFVCGISSFLQTYFGTRLPIIQGPAAAYLVPALSILSLKDKCPPFPTSNSTIEEKTLYQEEAYGRISEVQGALLIASIVQCLIGYTGSVSYITRYIGPIPIAVAVVNVGISIIPVIFKTIETHWGVAICGMFLIILFSQFFAKWNIPCRYNAAFRRFFTFFPVFSGAIITWVICAILTVANVFPDDPSAYGYQARTDIGFDVVSDTPWIYIPYPGQWGLPRFHVSGIVGMIAGALASILQSVGDYISFPLICGLPPLPSHSMNRGVGTEGVACLLASLCGTGCGFTSYTGNIAAVSLTRVGSRVVILTSALIFTVVGVIAKFSALCSTIPSPILGAVIAVILAMITGIGLTNLSRVKMNTPRNLFIVGFSFFLAIGLPQYINRNPTLINTGFGTFDDVISVILNNGMFVGGFSACLLDLTIAGTPEERGLTKNEDEAKKDETSELTSVYDLPFGTNWITGVKWFRYLPFCPTYRK